MTSSATKPAIPILDSRLRYELATGLKSATPLTSARAPDVVSMVRPPEPSEGGGSSAIWIAAGVAALLGIGIVVVRARSKR